MTFARPPREDYVRCSVSCLGFTIEPAIEYRDGDHFASLMYKLRNGAAVAVRNAIEDDMQSFDYRTPVPAPPPSPMRIAAAIAARMAEVWPDRAYFVEVWQDGLEGFAQIFQPFGVPRNQL